jgi:HPt (histidine-containing phosphotransfer) domain-containing protein
VARALPIFTREKLLDQLDDDEVLLQRMIALFLDHTPRHLDDIRSAIADHAAAALAHAAHALLSSLGAFGAVHAHQLALRLEGLGEAADFTAASAAFTALEQEAAQISAALEELAGAAVLGDAPEGFPGGRKHSVPTLPGAASTG